MLKPHVFSMFEHLRVADPAHAQNESYILQLCAVGSFPMLAQILTILEPQRG
jgi:hypothetical protein